MRKIRTMWIVIPLVVVIVLFAAVSAVLLSEREKSSGKEQVHSLYQQTEYTEYPEKWQEGTVSYKEHTYRYNSDNKIFLLMGIDKNEKVHVKDPSGASGGCSDAMFLLIQNKKENRLSIVSINRNTMARVAVYSKKGKKLGYYTLQICLQHAYGDGEKSSCSRAVEAVSYLFRDLPISGYMALNMSGIKDLNDAVGGVPVTVTEAMKEDLPQMDLEVGKDKTLTGEEAADFLKNRDQSQFDSATRRLKRQEVYLTGLFDKIKSTVAGNSKNAIKIYKALEEYLVTNMDVKTMVRQWMDYQYDPAALRTVPGKMVKGEKYEEYRVNDERLRALIMELFYEKVS